MSRSSLGSEMPRPSTVFAVGQPHEPEADGETVCPECGVFADDVSPECPEEHPAADALAPTQRPEQLSRDLDTETAKARKARLTGELILLARAAFRVAGHARTYGGVL